MFHGKRKAHQIPAAQCALVDGTGTREVVADDQTTPLPVLTRAEVLTTVNLLEQYIQLSSNEQATELAGTLIVRILDRLDQVGGPAIAEAAQ